MNTYTTILGPCWIQLPIFSGAKLPRTAMRPALMIGSQSRSLQNIALLKYCRGFPAAAEIPQAFIGAKDIGLSNQLHTVNTTAAFHTRPASSSLLDLATPTRRQYTVDVRHRFMNRIP